MTNLLDHYFEYQSQLDSADALMSLAECHGLFCGLLCLQSQADLSQCLPHIFDDEVDQQNILQAECIKSLEEMFRQTRIDLNDPGVEFSLLLANEDHDVATRVVDLQAWTQGYLFGLGLAGLDIEASAKIAYQRSQSDTGDEQEDSLEESAANTEISEMISDIIQISHVSVEGLSGSEDNEQDLYELIEYVRVGVLYIQEECNPLIKSSSLH